MYIDTSLLHTTTAFVVASIPSNFPTIKWTKQRANKLIHNSPQDSCFIGLTRHQQMNQRTCLQNRLCNERWSSEREAIYKEKAVPACESSNEATSCRRAVAVHLTIALPHNILQLGRQTSVELFYSTVNLGIGTVCQMLKRPTREPSRGRISRNCTFWNSRVSPFAFLSSTTCRDGAIWKT